MNNFDMDTMHPDLHRIMVGTIRLECERCETVFLKKLDSATQEYFVPPCPKCGHHNAYWIIDQVCPECHGSGTRKSADGLSRIACPHCSGHQAKAWLQNAGELVLYVVRDGQVLTSKANPHPWRQFLGHEI